MINLIVDIDNLKRLKKKDLIKISKIAKEASIIEFDSFIEFDEVLNILSLLNISLNALYITRKQIERE